MAGPILAVHLHYSDRESRTRVHHASIVHFESVTGDCARRRARDTASVRSSSAFAFYGGISGRPERDRQQPQAPPVRKAIGFREQGWQYTEIWERAD